MYVYIYRERGSVCTCRHKNKLLLILKRNCRRNDTMD